MGTGLMRALDQFAKEQDAAVVITYDRGLWSLLATFGKEAPDSPMAGGSLVGADPCLAKCVEQALADARIYPCATCGWEATCVEGCHT